MNIKEKVYYIINKVTGVEDIKDGMLLLSDLGLDSLEMIALLIELEESFNIELKESDMDPFNLKTVTDIINLADKYSEGKIER